MKILVTGGTGFIGSHTVVELLAAGYEVVIADNLSNSQADVIDRIAEITDVWVDFHQLDVTDEPGLEELFRDHNFDGVIHFAGYKAVGESVDKPLKYYENNVLSTIRLADACVRHGVGAFVFSSSATVYGDQEAPFDEGMELGVTTNPYGATKAMSERILMDVAGANPGFGVSLLRYFNPVGAHESGLIGENPAGIPNNLMPYVTQVARGKLDYLRVFGDDYPTADGTGVRDYIHVVDLAQGHVRAIESLTADMRETSQGKAEGQEVSKKEEANQRREVSQKEEVSRKEEVSKDDGIENKVRNIRIYNLGTGQGTSVLDLVKTFQEVNGVKVPYQIVPRRAGDIAISYADVAKVERELGWVASRGVADMCRDAWKFEQMLEK